MLNWQPTIKLDSGLKKIIDYLKDIVPNMNASLTTKQMGKYKEKGFQVQV